MIDLSMLSDEQLRVVMSNSRVICCTAKAGSGKTFTMIKRIEYLIDQGCRPDGILSFTFTKKAGDELKNRLKRTFMSSIASKISVGTMHSIFYSILRQELPLKNHDYFKMRIALEWEQKSLVREAFDRVIKKRVKGQSVSVAEVMISRAKNSLLTPEMLLEFLMKSNQQNGYWIAQVYKVYENIKKEKCLVDFDDMLIMPYYLLKEVSIREKWQNRWSHIMVDEYQDCNTAQIELVNVLAKKANLMVIGDANQAIYAFRGSKPEYIANMSKHYPNVEEIPLTKTFRCAREIVDVSNKMLATMGGGEMVTDRDGGYVEYLGHFEGRYEESINVLAAVKRLLDINQLNPNDIKVVYRTNVQSAMFEEVFSEYGIPHVVVGDNSFFDMKEVKDMLAYMRIIIDPHKAQSDYQRIMNKPNRFFSKNFLVQWKKKSVDYGSCFYALNSKYYNPTIDRNVAKFYDQINCLISISQRASSVGEVVQAIVRITEYDRWFEEEIEDKKKQENAVQRFGDTLNEFVEFSWRFTTIYELIEHVDMIKKAKKNNANSVQLMTIHKAKGAEAKAVFVVGLGDKLLPHSRGEMDEEKRLFYVAITRAIDYLFLSGYIEKGRGQYMAESRFLQDIEILN